jgi:hypothetical protein
MVFSGSEYLRASSTAPNPKSPGLSFIFEYLAARDDVLLFDLKDLENTFIEEV